VGRVEAVLEVFVVHLAQAESWPVEFLGRQSAGRRAWLFAALAASGLPEDAGDGARASASWQTQAL